MGRERDRKRRWGSCPQCMRTGIRLRVDGTLGAHPPRGEKAPVRCEGSGQVPAEDIVFKHEFRRFLLVRHDDPTGISGSGVVAEGVQFSDGECVIRWLVNGKPGSTVVWDSVDDAMAIHGHGNATERVWAEGDTE